MVKLHPRMLKPIRSTMPETHHIYLIPGFFGFVNFGRLVYFGHVRDVLEEVLDRYGMRAEIHRTRPSPTASLRQRAAQLHEHVRATAGGTGPIHLIGHSTGALDARLLVSPDVQLAASIDVRPIAQRVRSVVGVAAPHHGTPLASFFNGLLGQTLLRLLSLATVETLRTGRLPLSITARLGAALARASLPGGMAEAVLEQLYDELIQQLPAGDRDTFAEFFRLVYKDQALLPQLTPEGIDLFNAAAVDRNTVRYASVVTRAERPSMRRQLKVGVKPYDQATYMAFRALHWRTGVSGRWRPPPLSPEHRTRLQSLFGEVPSAIDSDGIVPTLSQCWGELLYGAKGDHLDVIGHFHAPKHQPPHRDWLMTHSGFGRPEFVAAWTAVAAMLARSA